MDLHAIIPAGGAGTRLWPLSRASHPKFLLPLTDPTRSLLTLTVARLAPLCSSITIVTGAEHVAAVTAHVEAALAGERQRPKIEILSEPSGRNSMPAIGLATARICRRYGSAAMVASFAADHTFAAADVLYAAISSATAAAADGEHLVTLGVEPDHAATGYGYIQPVETAGHSREDGEVNPLGSSPAADVPAAGETGGYSSTEATSGWQEVANFVEKPSPERAEKFLKQGYYWNAGIFVATAGYLLGALARHQPNLASSLTALAQEWGDMDPRARCERWEKLTPIAIDYALAEPEAQRGAVRVIALPRTAGWADVGDFTALANYPSAYQQIPVTVNASAAAWASPPTDNWEPKPVVIVGVEDFLVVQTPDAILVTNRQASQAVGQVPQKLREQGYSHLL